MTELAVYIGLILARVAAFVVVMPIFTARTPSSIRLSLIAALALYYLGMIGPTWDPKLFRDFEISGFVYLLALLREALIGAAVGFSFAMFLLPVRVAGEFLNQQIGLAVALQPSISGDTSGSTYSAIFEAIAVLLFLELDLHHVIFAMLHASFGLYPLGGLMIPEPTNAMTTQLMTAQKMGLILAAPLSLCMFLLTATLAIMSRAAPQLNIYSIGFGLQVLVGILSTLLLLPELVRTIINILHHLAVIAPATLR
jgi:flagellar biosynthesis protein FliR